MRDDDIFSTTMWEIVVQFQPAGVAALCVNVASVDAEIVS
jgi:hypothetical protein